MNRQRCFWATTELSIEYHDAEWGVPVHDDRTLFEFLTLEGAQAGLSWNTILQKRVHYKKVSDDFDVSKVALYDHAKYESLLADPGIVRNRLKISATINNAQRFLEVQQAFGSFDRYLWQFVDGKPVVNARQSRAEIPAKAAISDALSKDLTRRGFKFVGSTICYAMMQAVGMVNDHTTDCFCYAKASIKPQ
ncbi:MAG TPA: DNA-3-methyladenine glycosylase I [Methylophilaceae bacterium]|nr:DNA-3-methyladenine glycosylase I [Methylophilaceae bacterium]